MKQEAQFGSQEWADGVFSIPPVRNVNGKSRGTALFASKHNRKPVYAEGGNENVATYMLEYLQIIGVVSRWKSQPFFWQRAESEKERVPDFLVELQDRTRVVIQVKAERFLTPEVQRSFDDEREKCAGAGMLHIVWTDKAPLNGNARDLFLKIRMARATTVESERLVNLVEFVRKFGQVSFPDLIEANHAPYLVPVAIRRGELFVNLKEKLDERSIISTSPITDGRGFLLQSGFDAQSWWNSLPN